MRTEHHWTRLADWLLAVVRFLRHERSRSRRPWRRYALAQTYITPCDVTKSPRTRLRETQTCPTVTIGQGQGFINAHTGSEDQDHFSDMSVFVQHYVTVLQRHGNTRKRTPNLHNQLQGVPCIHSWTGYTPVEASISSHCDHAELEKQDLTGSGWRILQPGFWSSGWVLTVDEMEAWVCCRSTPMTIFRHWSPRQSESYSCVGG